MSECSCTSVVEYAQQRGKQLNHLEWGLLYLCLHLLKIALFLWPDFSWFCTVHITVFMPLTSAPSDRLNQWMVCVIEVMLRSSSHACFFPVRGIYHWLEPLILKLIIQQCKLQKSWAEPGLLALSTHLFFSLPSLLCIFFFLFSLVLNLCCSWLLAKKTSYHPHLWKPTTKSLADDHFLSSPFSSLCPFPLCFL